MLLLLLLLYFVGVRITPDRMGRGIKRIVDSFHDSGQVRS